jgi:hypothetical protein
MKAGLAVPSDPGHEGTFTIRIKQLDGTVVRTVTGITGVTWTYTEAMRLTDGFDGSPPPNFSGNFIFEISNIDAAVGGYTIEREIRLNLDL